MGLNHALIDYRSLAFPPLPSLLLTQAGTRMERNEEMRRIHESYKIHRRHPSVEALVFQGD